ncbi:Lsr2 family DNA-binding protein [Streptomyces flaveolus]|uniref:Lsr2 family DNA-binding protein n=1 Tax=Streptomyces flaveolus TaxID=67297 RepID=UPI0036F708DB
MTDLTTLTQLCTPPGQDLGLGWGTVEAGLGMPLPRDYKQLADRYGPGSFNDYLSLFHPHGVTEFVDLTGPVPGRIRAQLRKDYDQGTHPVPHDPDTLFACGATDNGEYLFWITDPAGDPDRWRIAVNEARGPRWFTYDGTLTAFLTGVLTGQTRVPQFPSSLLDAPARFTPSRPTLVEPAPPTATRPADTAVIRSWARANGYQVPPRGRIPIGVREAWERATRR